MWSQSQSRLFRASINLFASSHYKSKLKEQKYFRIRRNYSRMYISAPNLRPDFKVISLYESLRIEVSAPDHHDGWGGGDFCLTVSLVGTLLLCERASCFLSLDQAWHEMAVVPNRWVVVILITGCGYGGLAIRRCCCVCELRHPDHMPSLGNESILQIDMGIVVCCFRLKKNLTMREHDSMS